LQFQGFTLNPFQVKAAESIQAGKSVLVSAPTGAGKTLVAEYAIHDALQRGRRVIYTAPIKALSNQKFRDFRASEHQVGIMTGDVTLNPQAPLLIMTTEIFRNTIFEDPRRLSDVDFAIFDEIHFMDDPERGSVWEESIIFAPENVRFICLSATVSNLDQFGNWIREVRKHPLDVILWDRRPVPLAHKLFHTETGVFNLEQLRPAQEKALRALRRTHGRRGRHHHEGPNVLHAASRMLLDELVDKRMLPILYFCFSRRECEIKADRNAHRELLSHGEQERLDTLFGEVCRLYQLNWSTDPELASIRRRALLGIGYHHAGMLPIHKEVVERLFTSGLLKLLFTTETFALGINMPARTVVFNSLRKFTGQGFGYMMTREYLQMAGRAGRQGIDKEGYVYSILDTDDLKVAPLARILKGKVEPIQSKFNLSYNTLLNLYARLGMELIHAYEKSFNYFQAVQGSKKRKETIKNRETGLILRKLHILREAGYIDDQGLLPRGKIAQQISGYEIQITELLFDGVLDSLDIHQLGAVFTGLVYEERRGDEALVEPGSVFKGKIGRIYESVRRFVVLETRNGIEATTKEPDFGLSAAVVAWSKGVDLGELENYTTATPGDLVRSLRMAIQMMRQLRKTLSGDYPLRDRLEESVVSLNRDVVDARRQLELG
jgi:superfamily II RNA helicase